MNQFLKLRGSQRGVDHVNIAHAQRARQILEDHFAGLGVSQRAPRPWVLLHARHGRGSIVQDQHHMAAFRRVVDHLDEAGDSAVNERAVANDAHHALRILGRQRVAQPQAHADGRAHAYQRIHGLERRQHAQGIAADIAGDDAVQVLEGRVDAAMRTAGAQSRRLAGNALRLRRIVALKNAAHAGGVQFAEAEGLRLALDRDGRRPRALYQVRIAFFDDQAALDAGGEGAHPLHGQRIGHSQLQHTGLGRNFAHILERDARGNDSERGRACDQFVRSRLVVPSGDLRELLAQAQMRRARVGRNHHAGAEIVLEARRARRRNRNRSAPDDGL